MTASVAVGDAPVRLKARDAAWTVAVIDPIAVPLVRRAASRAAITPNRLTVASALLAVVAGAAFALDALIVGALLYQASFLLDCMDGKLASARGERNPLGGWYDVIGDTIRLIACAIGLTVALGADSTLAAAVLMSYVSLRFGVLAIASGRPEEHQREAAHLTVPARFTSVLRAAPRRSAPPGTTVDAEALVFTLGPLVGLPVLAAGLAAVVELAHLLMYVVAAVASSRGGNEAP